MMARKSRSLGHACLAKWPVLFVVRKSVGVIRWFVGGWNPRKIDASLTSCPPPHCHTHTIHNTTQRDGNPPPRLPSRPGAATWGRGRRSLAAFPVCSSALSTPSASLPLPGYVSMSVCVSQGYKEGRERMDGWMDGRAGGLGNPCGDGLDVRMCAYMRAVTGAR